MLSKWGRNNVIFVVLVVVVIVTVVLIAINQNKTEKTAKEQIDQEIEKANYCNIKEDCNLLDSSTFGCFVYVNTNDISRINTLIKDYNKKNNVESGGCIAVVTYPKCEGGKCIVSYQEE